MISIIAGDY